MPAFGFRPQFRDPIRSGVKTHTIRAAIPRGYVLGHWSPFYTGLRTKNVDLVGSGCMAAPQEVRLDFDAGTVEGVTGYPLTDMRDLDAFAVSDGFGSWPDMELFWSIHHPGVCQFTGWLLPWVEFTLEHRLGGA